jgi:ribosomal protein L15E
MQVVFHILKNDAKASICRRKCGLVIVGVAVKSGGFGVNYFDTAAGKRTKKKQVGKYKIDD